MILGAILTQNTAWKNVEKAVTALKADRRLSLAALRKVPIRRLARTIRSSGFFNIKARRIKNFVGYIDRHHGSIGRLLSGRPGDLRRRLLEINGIGRETADSIVLYAARKPVFVVDAYTRRIFSRLGLISGREDYETIRRIFETTLPKCARLYNEYHALIVRHAKEFCRRDPLCETCPITKICPKELA